MTIEDLKGLENARKFYAQAILSGFGAERESGKETSGNSSSEDKTYGETPKKFWEQDAYLVFVPLVIKPFDVSGSSYECEISIPLNVDIPIRLYRSRSKKMSQFTTYLLAEKSKDATKLCLVSGISETGIAPLSPSPEHTLPEAIAYVFSRVLGIVNRASRCIVHERKDAKNYEDARERKESASSPKDVGKHTNGGGSEEIRSKVLSKKGAKENSKVDGMDG